MIPATGPISVNAVNAELGRSANASFSMADGLTRKLAGKTAGSYTFNDFRSKFLGTGQGSAAPASTIFVLPSAQVIDGGTIQSFLVNFDGDGNSEGLQLNFASGHPSSWTGNYNITNVITGVSITIPVSNPGNSWLGGISNAQAVAMIRPGVQDSFQLVHA